MTEESVSPATPASVGAGSDISVRERHENIRETSRAQGSVEQLEADALDHARDELWRNAHHVAGFMRLVIGNLRMGSDDGLALAFEAATLHFDAARRHEEAINAARRVSLRMAPDLDADHLRFSVMADRNAAIWRAASNAALRGETGLITLHCAQAASSTREAFAAARKWKLEDGGAA